MRTEARKALLALRQCLGGDGCDGCAYLTAGCTRAMLKDAADALEQMDALVAELIEERDRLRGLAEGAESGLEVTFRDGSRMIVDPQKVMFRSDAYRERDGFGEITSAAAFLSAGGQIINWAAVETIRLTGKEKEP